MLRQAALGTLSQPFVGRLLATLRRDRCALFMLHRFASVNGQPNGHNSEGLRALLEYLRRARIDIRSADELVASHNSGAARTHNARPCVAFTVDDGYRDFAEVGLPVFEQYDCPVTLFVAPSVADGDTWFWWDQLEWAFEHAQLNQLKCEVDGLHLDVHWHDDASRRQAMKVVLATLKRVSDEARRDFVGSLATWFEAEVPKNAPARYAVLNWDSLRSIEARGVRIGPHTMSHPILARCSDSVARFEILESVARVRATFANPSRVFCYPNGISGDFGQREYALLHEAGMSGAVTAEPGRVVLSATDIPTSRWTVPRFSYEAAPGMTARLLFL